MKEIDPEEMERILGRAITLELNLNDLRILVSCFSAVAYWAEVDEKAYMDSDAWKLKERLEGLYRDELDYPFPTRKEEPSLCIGY
jgi:hypothetical protein